ncbi:MAG: hypothetical protein ABW069_15985 [Duganella sp.]
MQEFEKWLARVLLLNSALALGVSLGLLGTPQYGSALTVLYSVAMLGLAAAVLSLRRHVLGLWGSVLFYLLQVVAYFPYDGSWQFSIKAGVNVGLVMRWPHGVVVVNMVALALLVATVAVLVRRVRQGHLLFHKVPNVK